MVSEVVAYQSSRTHPRGQARLAATSNGSIDDWLTCGGTPLAWAESWWNQAEADWHLRDRNQPIWKSLTEGRSELFREVDGLALVEGDWLDQTFGHRGPYWSRHYRFFRQGKALTVIREVFSPQLETWLGPTLRQEFQQNS